MTSVPMNPLNFTNAAKSASPAAIGINRQPSSHFARPAKSRARPPSP